VVDDRQREGRGLAGSGLRNADDIAALQHDRNGLILDRGGSDVFLFSEGAKDRLSEAKSLNEVKESLSYMANRPARSCERRNRGVLKTSRVARVVGRLEKQKRRGEKSF